jgi:hypothetical protein
VHLHALDYVLWVSAPLLQGTILFILHRRGLAAQLPFFCSYVAFQVVSDLYLMGIAMVSYTMYYYAYWAGTAITVLLTLALIDELFRLSFRNFTAIRDLGTRIFRWAALLVFFAEIISLDMHAKGVVSLTQQILIADRAVRILMCSLAVLLLLGASILRIPWRSALFGIALGFAFFMSTRALLDSVYLDKFANRTFLVRGNSLLYISSCLVWLGYASYGNPVPEPILSGPELADGASEVDQRTLLETINAVVERSMENTRKEP